MRHLRDVAWCTNATEAHAEPQNKAASQEHSSVDRWSLDAGTGDNNDSSCKHTGSAAKVVVYWPAKEDGRNRADVVDRECDTGATASRCHIEVFVVGIHSIESSH